MTQKRLTLVEDAVGQIIELIEERGLRDGDLLPSMADLTSSLGVSRTVVREAIAELAGQGLVRRHQGRETVVSTPQAFQVARLMRMWFMVGSRDEQALLEYAALVAVAAAKTAAQRASLADVDAIAVWLEQLRNSDNSVRDAEHGFFRAVGKATRNDLMLMTFEAMGPLIAELHSNDPAVQSDRDWLVEICSELLTAISSSDADCAGAAMRAYIAGDVSSPSSLRPRRQ